MMKRIKVLLSTSSRPSFVMITRLDTREKREEDARGGSMGSDLVRMN